LAARLADLGGGTIVRRLLPNLGRRMVGAWCFIDHYGPDSIAGLPGMQVAPHPHIGLQTVSWLLAGEVLHRDSLGSLQTLRSGQLGLMTAGAGIAHSEESPPEHASVLHGVQLWVALPDRARHLEPAFDFHPDLPVLTDGAMTARVLLGEMAGAAGSAKAAGLASPGVVHSPIAGIDASLGAGGAGGIPLERDFEYALLVPSGRVRVEGVEVAPGTLLYLGRGRTLLRLESDGPSRALLLGGEPFGEKIVMWWNFVGRTGEEIAEARRDWEEHTRFGSVQGFAGDSVPAPALPAGRLVPRGSE
jgi:quercetin 2,3-dioxygenase